MNGILLTLGAGCIIAGLVFQRVAWTARAGRMANPPKRGVAMAYRVGGSGLVAVGVLAVGVGLLR